MQKVCILAEVIRLFVICYTVNCTISRCHPGTWHKAIMLALVEILSAILQQLYF